MSEALAVDFICPRCGNAWSDDLSHLDRADQEIDKSGSTANVRYERYRVKCSVCSERWIYTVKITEDGNGKS